MLLDEYELESSVVDATPMPLSLAVAVAVAVEAEAAGAEAATLLTDTAVLLSLESITFTH